jgi:hypothetical protein
LIPANSWNQENPDVDSWDTCRHAIPSAIDLVSDLDKYAQSRHGLDTATYV